MAKLFSTPIACGLVTGALAGAVFLGWQWTNAVARVPMFGIEVVLDFTIMTLLCSGPALCRRSLPLVLFALAWGTVAAAADMSVEYYQEYIATFMVNFAWYSLSSALSGAVIGIALWRMYRSRTRLLWVILLSVLGQMSLLGMTYLEYGEGMGGKLELFAMPALLGYIAAATLPVIAIDREQRARNVP